MALACFTVGVELLYSNDKHDESIFHTETIDVVLLFCSMYSELLR